MTGLHFNTRHGHARRGSKSLTYRTWASMFNRCYNEKQGNYKDYGAKGVCVALEWHDFDCFLRDMGEQPPGMTLERRNPMLWYSAANCEWATPLTQARNKTNTRWLTYQGETLCLTEWAERLGLKPKTLRARLDDHGWTVEQALGLPVMTLQDTARHAQMVRYGRAESIGRTTPTRKK